MALKLPSSTLRGKLNLPTPAIGTPLPPIPLIVADVIFNCIINLASLRTILFAARSMTNLTLSVSITKQIGCCRNLGTPVVFILPGGATKVVGGGVGGGNKSLVDVNYLMRLLAW